MLHEAFLIVFQNVSNVFENLVHVLVVMVFKGFHGLFSFAFLEVVHFEFVVVEQFEVIIDFSITLLSGLDELVVPVAVILISGTVGVVECVRELGDIVDVGSFDSGFKIASHLVIN